MDYTKIWTDYLFFYKDTIEKNILVNIIYLFGMQIIGAYTGSVTKKQPPIQTQTSPLLAYRLLPDSFIY